jgi:hypothetical protein
MEPLEENSILRFRSGVHYNYVAIRRDGRWRTSSSGWPRTDIDVPINELGWNAINKIEHWTDLVARGNSFSIAADWVPAPVMVTEELAVVRFLLDEPAEWHAGIHVGRRSWYTTVDAQASDNSGPGLRIYEYPRLRGLGDIVEHSTQIDLVTRWDVLPGVGLPTYR